MKKQEKNRTGDWLLLLALVAAGCLLALLLFFAKKVGSTVEVRVNGETVCTLPLNRDTEYEIEGYDGGKNLLIIRNGEAWMESASCPDGLCVHMGHIKEVGRSVICLPNKVVVEIKGDVTEQDLPDMEAGGR